MDDDDDWKDEAPNGEWPWQLSLCEDIEVRKKNNSKFYRAKCTCCGHVWGNYGTQAVRIANHYGVAFARCQVLNGEFPPLGPWARRRAVAHTPNLRCARLAWELTESTFYRPENPETTPGASPGEGATSGAVLSAPLMLRRRRRAGAPPPERCAESSRTSAA